MTIYYSQKGPAQPGNYAVVKVLIGICAVVTVFDVRKISWFGYEYIDNLEMSLYVITLKKKINMIGLFVMFIFFFL